MYMYVPGLRYLGLGTQGERRRRASLEFGVIWVPGLGYLGLDTYSWWRTRAILESQATRVLGLRHCGSAQSSFLPSEYILETQPSIDFTSDELDKHTVATQSPHSCHTVATTVATQLPLARTNVLHRSFEIKQLNKKNFFFDCRLCTKL